MYLKFGEYERALKVIEKNFELNKKSDNIRYFLIYLGLGFDFKFVEHVL